MNTTLKAFHGSQEIKDKYLARVKSHRAADQLIQGVGWNKLKNRGCAVGCTLEAYVHSQYPIELGIPVILAHLEDGIFEGLSPDKAQEWPEQFLSAIQPGADLSMVWPHFALWLLADDECGVINYGKSALWMKAIEMVECLYKRRINGDVPERQEWKEVAPFLNVFHTRALSRIAAGAINEGFDPSFSAAYMLADDVADRAGEDYSEAYQEALAEIRAKHSVKLIELLKAAN